MTVLLVLAGCAALAAAVRSTWSPCGQSMLSSITPLTERARGGRFGVTASWFVLGAVGGGLTLGAACAALAVGVAALDPGSAPLLVAAGVAALAGAAGDAGWIPRPGHHRQVNERWLDRYRSWVYGLGFGWQIGVGLATYIMTAAVYLLVVLAALGSSPLAALGLGALFGAVRGLAVLATARVRTPEALGALHRRFDALAPASRRLVIGAQLVIAVVAVSALDVVAGAGLACALAALLVAVTVATRPPSAHAPELVTVASRSTA